MLDSVAGHAPPPPEMPEFTMYFASKHAVTVLTEGLRREILNLKANIRVAVYIYIFLFNNTNSFNIMIFIISSQNTLVGTFTTSFSTNATPNIYIYIYDLIIQTSNKKNKIVLPKVAEWLIFYSCNIYVYTYLHTSEEIPFDSRLINKFLFPFGVTLTSDDSTLDGAPSLANNRIRVTFSIKIYLKSLEK